MTELEQPTNEFLRSEVVSFGNETVENRPTIIFVTKDTGSGEVVAPVIKVLDKQVNWTAYSQGKSLPVMIGYNFPFKPEAPEYINAVKVLHPDVVVTGVSQSGPGVERALTRRGKKGGCPVVWIVDSQGGVDATHFQRLYRLSKEFPGYYKTGAHPDYLCVQDENVKDVILNSSIPGIKEAAERILVTGQPAFDATYSLVQRREEIRLSIRQKLGLAPDEKTILFAGQLDGTKETLEEIIKALNRNPEDITLAVRFHPRDKHKDSYNSLLNSYKGKWIEVGGDKVANADEMVLAADATLSMFSTLNMRAIYFGLPTAYILSTEEAKAAFRKDWQIDENNLPMVKSGCAAGIYAEGEISQFLDQIYNPGYLQNIKKAQQANYPFDGKSAERVAEVILKLAEN